MAEHLKFVVTHFYRRSPDERVWKQTSFITRIVGDDAGTYYLGIPSHTDSEAKATIISKPIHYEKIRNDVENGSLKELPVEHPIELGNTIWITPEQEVIIANSYNPSVGEQRSIDYDKILSVYDTMKYLVLQLLEVDDSADFENILAPYTTQRYWNILLSIVMKFLETGKITEDLLPRFGFIFIDFERTYKDEFIEEMNYLDASYSSDGYIRFRLKYTNVEWPIKSLTSEEKMKTYKKLAESPYYEEVSTQIKYIETPEAA